MIMRNINNIAKHLFCKWLFPAILLAETAAFVFFSCRDIERFSNWKGKADAFLNAMAVVEIFEEIADVAFMAGTLERFVALENDTGQAKGCNDGQDDVFTAVSNRYWRVMGQNPEITFLKLRKRFSGPPDSDESYIAAKQYSQIELYPFLRKLMKVVLACPAEAGRPDVLEAADFYERYFFRCDRKEYDEDGDDGY